MHQQQNESTSAGDFPERRYLNVRWHDLQRYPVKKKMKLIRKKAGYTARFGGQIQNLHKQNFYLGLLFDEIFVFEHNLA